VEANQDLHRLQGLMVFLASAANGLEELLGRGAGSVTFRAGRLTGLRTEVAQTEHTDVLKALDLVWDEMCRIGMRWAFTPYQQSTDEQLVVEEDGELKIKLVFGNCMIRSSLFRYSHPQRLSLCMMNHGLFCGLFEQIYGRRANLEIIHAGENACLKLLTVRGAGGE